jgi:hypothetical protein
MNPVRQGDEIAAQPRAGAVGGSEGRATIGKTRSYR